MYEKRNTACDLAFQRNLRELTAGRGGKVRLGKAIGKTDASISSYVTGRTVPSLHVLVQIADYYNVSVDWLLGRKEKDMAIMAAEKRGYMKGVKMASDALFDIHLSFEKIRAGVQR